MNDIYRGYAANRIYSKSAGKFHCHACNLSLRNHEEAAHHITYDKSHKSLCRSNARDISGALACFSEEECEKLVGNGVFLKTPPFSFQCDVCHCPIHHVNNVWQHIEGYIHTTLRQNSNHKVPETEQQQLVREVNNVPSEEKQIAECKICKVTVFLAEDWTNHVNGKRHKRNLLYREQQLTRKLEKNEEEKPFPERINEGKNESGSKKNKGEIKQSFDYCDLCDFNADKQTFWEQHLSGTEHLENVFEELQKIKQQRFGVLEIASNHVVQDFPDSPKKFYARCKLCCETFDEEEKWTLHLLSFKHQLRLIIYEDQSKLTDVIADFYAYCSLCKTKHSLSNHWENHVLNDERHVEKVLENVRDSRFEKEHSDSPKTILNNDSIFVYNNAKEEKNIAYVQTFLEPGEANIFKPDPQLLRRLRLSSKSSFLLHEKIHCIICTEKMKNETQLFLEHCRSPNHMENAIKLEENDKEFENCGNQFSDLKLCKLLMKEISEDQIHCFACEIPIENEDEKIQTHAMTLVHVKNQSEMKKRVPKLEENLASWYDVQKFKCEICRLEFGSELFFSYHLTSPEHDKNVTGPAVFDGCVACSLFWLGNAKSYEFHVRDATHKYFLRNGEFGARKMAGNLENLSDLDEYVGVLTKCSDRVRPEIGVLDDFRDAVKMEPRIFGSRICNTAFPESNVDIFLDSGNFTAVEESLKSSNNFRVNKIFWNAGKPVIRAYHCDTRIDCDVAFSDSFSTLEQTKLLRLFVEVLPQCRGMILFLKKWIRFVPGINSHVISWLVIFYLQKSNVFPSVDDVMGVENENSHNWETLLRDKVCSGAVHPPITYWLLGFFNFYAGFDYKTQVMCPISGTSVRKMSFIRSGELEKKLDSFPIESPMCLQNPFDLTENLTSSVTKMALRSFQFCCIETEKFLDF